MPKIKEIKSDEDIQEIEKKSKEDAQKRSVVKENIISMLSGKPPREDNFFKSLTIRLTPHDYASLSVLSSRLNQSTSGLAKLLLVDAVSDGISAYLSVKEFDDEFAGESFAEDVYEQEQRIIEELI